MTVPIVAPGCDFCPDNSSWGTAYQENYGVSQLVPARRVPSQFYLVHDVQPIGGAHFLLSSKDHFISTAALPRRMPFARAVSAAVSSLRESYGSDRRVLVFEHGPGFIEGEPIACGGCNTSHNHVHLVVLPRSAQLNIEKFRSAMEGKLNSYGWTDIANRRFETRTPLAGISDHAGDQPYLHWGLYDESGTPSYACTYVQGSTSERLPSRFLSTLVLHNVFNSRDPMAVGHDRDIFVRPPGKVPIDILRPLIQAAGYARSVPGSVTPLTGPGHSHDPVVVINGISGSGKSYVGRQLAQHLGWRFLDAGYVMRTIVWAARKANVSEFDPTALRLFAEKLELRFNTSSKQGSWVAEINNETKLSEADLKAVSVVAAQMLPALQFVAAEQVRRIVGRGRIVVTGRSVDVTVPVGMVPVVFQLKRSLEETLTRADDMSLALVEAEMSLLVREPIKRGRSGNFPTFAPDDRTHIIDISSNTDPKSAQALSEMIAICRDHGVLRGPDVSPTVIALG